MTLPAYIIEEISKRKTGKDLLEELSIELPEEGPWMPQFEKKEDEPSEERGVAIIDFSI